MRISHWSRVWALLAVAGSLPFCCNALHPRNRRVADVQVHSAPSSSRGGAPADDADVPVSDFHTDDSVALADGSAADDTTGDVDVDKVLADAGAAETGDATDGLGVADEAQSQASASDTDEDQAAAKAQEAAKKAKLEQEANAKEQKAKEAKAKEHKAKKSKSAKKHTRGAKGKAKAKSVEATPAPAKQQEAEPVVAPALLKAALDGQKAVPMPATKAASSAALAQHGAVAKKGRHSLAGLSQRGGVRHKNVRRGNVSVTVNNEADDADDDKDDDDDSNDDAEKSSEKEGDSDKDDLQGSAQMARQGDSDKDVSGDSEVSAADQAQLEHATAAKAKKDVDEKDEKAEFKEEHAIEAKFTEHINQDEDLLKKNLEKQAELKTELSDTSDEAHGDEDPFDLFLRGPDKDIDEAVRPIVNETHSPAIALVLSKMWKEMRTYERPAFRKQLMEDLEPLEKSEHILELDLNATESNLSMIKAEFAKEESDETDAEADDAEEDGADKINATALVAANGSADTLALHVQEGEHQQAEADTASTFAKPSVPRSGAPEKFSLMAPMGCLTLAVLSCYF